MVNSKLSNTTSLVINYVIYHDMTYFFLYFIFRIVKEQIDIAHFFLKFHFQIVKYKLTLFVFLKFYFRIVNNK